MVLDQAAYTVGMRTGEKEIEDRRERDRGQERKR
jgi:hypothetical protein